MVSKNEVHIDTLRKGNYFTFWLLRALIGVV
jgi:hypothetical protein